MESSSQSLVRPVFIGAIQDVTESKLAEAAPRESEREWRRIVDSIPGLVATLTPAGEVEGVNNQVLEYCGRTLEELKQWGTSDTVHPEDRPRVIEVITQSMASGDPYEIEERIRRFDGVYRWFQVRGLPLRDSNGRIVRWYDLLTDIDDRKRAEAQLAGEKRLLEMVASSCPLTDVLTALCRFVEVTSADCHCGVYLIDWSGPRFRNGAVPSLPATFNDPTDGLPVRREIGPCGQAALFRQQVIAIDLETDPLWQESAIRPLALAHGIRSHWSTPIYARDGRVLGTFAIFHREPASPTRVQQDLIAQVTHIASIAIERALSEAALDKLRSELAHVTRVMSLGALTASIAHEVNQPLSGIITNASTCLRMLNADPPNVDGARETARRTIRDGNRASEVIARLRALFSKKEFTLESVDLNEATREVTALSLSDLQRNRVMLQFELADDLPAVSGDRVQLQQVILNLLRNASDAMAGVDDRPRQLRIRTELDAANRVRLTVQDVGVGFDPQNVDKLFAPFYTTKTDSMGIGLSISSSIIERHHGRLWAAPNDGPGATFSFSIPRSSEAVPSPPNRDAVRAPAATDAAP
jgi:PAS domain S-box-containing protein